VDSIRIFTRNSDCVSKRPSEWGTPSNSYRPLLVQMLQENQLENWSLKLQSKQRKGKGKVLVDVTGIGPVTPCLQSRPGKILTALSGVDYTETDKILALLNVPKLSRTRPKPRSFRTSSGMTTCSLWAHLVF